MAGQANSHGTHGSHHSPSHYVKIWALLLALLIVSIVGPMFGNKILTLVTAFGVAGVKAFIVAAFFMHLNVERKFIWYMLLTMVAFLVLFFFATAPDVMRFHGSSWTKPAALKYSEEFEAKHGGTSHGKSEHH